MIEKIDKITELLDGYENYSLVDQRVNRLTVAGENYGSLILAVEIILKNKKTGDEKILKTVAKLIPPTDFMQKVFNVQVTFKNEIALYEIIVPTLQNFRRKLGLEELAVFVHSYGSRLNLNGSNVVDENGVLIMENLKMAGYTMFDRLTGFDLETAKFIVKELANFHATSLSLKLSYPDIFNKKFTAYFNDFVLPEEERKKMVHAWRNTLEENPVRARLCSRILSSLENPSTYKPREPLATFVHSDLWINNIMVKSINGRTKNVKFLDFQFQTYRSPVADLIFFLLSSVSTEILQDNLDYFLEYYYRNFTEMLSQMKCEIPSLTLDFFLEEVRIEAQQAELYHIGYMTMVLYASKDDVKDVGEFNDKVGIFGQLSTLQKEKIWFFAQEFAKRNWI